MKFSSTTLSWWAKAGIGKKAVMMTDHADNCKEVHEGILALPGGTKAGYEPKAATALLVKTDDVGGGDFEDEDGGREDCLGSGGSEPLLSKKKNGTSQKGKSRLVESLSKAAIGIVNTKSAGNYYVASTNNRKDDVGGKKENGDAEPRVEQVSLATENATNKEVSCNGHNKGVFKHAIYRFPDISFLCAYCAIFYHTGRPSGSPKQVRSQWWEKSAQTIRFGRVKSFLLVMSLFLSSSNCCASTVRGRKIWASDHDTRQLEPLCTTSSQCDDGNSMTIDTCKIVSDTVSICDYECNDNNMCTNEGFDNDGVCRYYDDCAKICEDDQACMADCEESNENNDARGLLACDDQDPLTVDVCIPQTGCKYISLEGTADEIEQEMIDLPPSTYFYEDPVTLTETQVKNYLKWIQAEVVQLRTPFCWRRSYGRGVGKVLSTCPPGKEKIGALCYTPCPNGYSRQGTFDCQQECKGGWRDDGLFCRKPEYWRGAGFPWEIGDALNDKGMFRRCGGREKCEKYGAIVYPKCREGYSNFGCCICRPSPTPDCRAEGYNGGFDLSCAVYIIKGDPTPLQCKDGEEEDGGLCYPPCDEGFDGVGPVCWQKCDTDQSSCAAGCARSALDCGFAITDQILGPVVIAANIVTLGGAGAVDTAADTIEVGTDVAKSVNFYSKAGKLFLKVGKKLLKAAATNYGTLKDANVLKRLWKARAGTKLKKLLRAGRVSSVAYGTYTAASYSFARDFEDMTSTEIANKIDQELTVADAFYVKQRWAQVANEELREALDWMIADITLSAVGLADPTGIIDTVNAYAKPRCALIVPFPTNSNSNLPPQAQCRDVTIVVNSYSDCKGEVLGSDVGFFSTDDSGDENLSYLLDDERDKNEYDVFGSPYDVELTVLDAFSLSDSCDALITVTDPTPSIITCPPAKREPSAVGQCGAIVNFDTPEVENNCLSTSTTMQTNGLPSGSLFPAGNTTQNTFKVLDSLGNENFCSFKVTINDEESPSISCIGLGCNAAALETDPGKCTRSYEYVQPVGEDNCGAITVQTRGPPFGSPYEFPVGTTINEFTAYDGNANNESCAFDVVVLDKEKPTIQCPVETIRPCNDTDPEKTGTATTTDNCEDESPPVLTYKDDTNDGINGVCPEITTRNWLSEDWKGNFNSCTQKIIEVEPDALTDSTLCLYQKATINTVFTPDITRKGSKGKSKESGKGRKANSLTTTTAGQFVYHAFYVGTPDELVSLTLEIPYPFVTRGDKPVYAYDWLDIETGTQGEPCFIPKGNRTEYDFQITTDDYDVKECGERKEVIINAITPSTGFIHLSIDLEFGLKGIGNIERVTHKKSYKVPNKNGTVEGVKGSKYVYYELKKNDTIDALSDAIFLQDRCPFEFSVSGAFSSASTVKNVNVFKSNDGVAGFVLDYFQNPVSGISVMLFHQEYLVVGSAETDADGYYNIAYKHKGKPEAYTVVLATTLNSQSVEIELNKHNPAVVNFDV